MNAVIDALEEALGPDIVLSGDAVPERNRNDWSGLDVTRPMAVLRPRNTAEIATALKICHAHHQAVVPQGGLTGLCGGARARDGEIALSLERLRGVEEVDTANATMTVWAGTALEEVQRAAEEARLMCPLDLGARGTAAIGGNVATNAGGNRVIRYGMTRDMVLGLEVVLADGTVLTSLNKMIKNNAGFDLKQLFIGSEGLLGVITRIVLRLQPLPQADTAAFVGLKDFDAVMQLLQRARSDLSGTLSAFEVLWPRFYESVTTMVEGIRAPLEERHGIYVLMETQGADADIDGPRFERLLESLFEAGIIEDAALAQSAADIKAFWTIRDAVAENGEMLGEHVNYDIGLPVRKMQDFVAQTEGKLQTCWPGTKAFYFGHIGDGNIHVVLHAEVEGAQPKPDIDALIYGVARDMGGTISAEHGIGTLKQSYLGYTRSPEELAVMQTIKYALDPRSILNPGKVLLAET
ncbi:MAG: FAD-binding oxidoreductase [Pseudomonadota bacterium]